jgi:hypothetical protein
MDVLASASPTSVLSRQLAINNGGGISVPGDPGARGMMDANSYKPSPMSLNANSLGSYNEDMAKNFAHQKALGMRVKPYSQQTMASTTWSKQ